MSNPSQTRHAQLIAAGWRYDAAQDRYTPPGDVQKGTEKWYDQGAAWLQQSAAQQPTQPQKRSTPVRDPRKQEPQ